MKNCRTTKGLIRAVKKGEMATLKVWDIMQNHYDPKGAYLNLGEGRYAAVGSKEWSLIRNHIVNEHGVYHKNLNKNRYFYEALAS